MPTSRFYSRLVLPALATALCLAPVSAQSLEGWGVTAGLNRATLAGGFTDLIRDVGGTVEARYGITVGGYARFELAEGTTLRPELTLTQKGFRVPAENGVKRRDLNLSYLDVAALVRRGISVGSMQGWVGAGPMVSMNLSASGQVGDVEGDYSDEIKGSDFGLGLEAGMNAGLLGVGLRYTLGVSNISTSTDPDESSKTRGLMILVSYAVR